MDLADIRRLVIIAMFSDDVLFEQLALKGGNAVNLVHRLGTRSSIDVDFSLQNDFADVEDSRKRIFRALRARFSEVGFTLFDEKFERKPLEDKAGDEKWGGYQIEFKLFDTAKYAPADRDLERARREALVVGPSDQRVFRIQISKYEFCEGKVEADLKDYSIYVYTPAMIAIEKLRAICQQMPEYPMRRHPTPRARDFYDIFATVTGVGVSLNSPENLELVRNIFSAKTVELALLARIELHREFHRQDWPSVELTTTGALESFDYYFDFVVEQARLLKSLWDK
ncbi:MAG: nucleotidyl transferase AbiEii/AbiGii toxin family protein [Candidatus Acidiferrales bacterium]